MSKIEWTDKTWNPITGCSPASRACENCYTFPMIRRLQANPRSAKKYKFGSKVVCHPGELQKPFIWKKPCRVFVCSMSDLFHQEVPFSFISEVFSVMGQNPEHTFLVLTKRPHRALEFLRDVELSFPSNVWFGVSVEDQHQAGIRIPPLLSIPAPVLFVSAEPLLEKIDVTQYLYPCFHTHYSLLSQGKTDSLPRKLDWVIAGGETGYNARPLDPTWIYSLLNQLIPTRTPFFFKSWGNNVVNCQPIDLSHHRCFPFFAFYHNP